jgi:hypothetical protein
MFAMTDPSRFLGTWKLVSIVREEVPSGVRTDLFGPDPIGYLNYSPDGRMMTVIVRRDRKRPSGHPISADEAVGLFRSMISYAGAYELQGEEVIHYVDISANELWTGTEQRRFFKFEDKRLTLSTPVNPDPIDGKTSVRSMIWERLE